NPSLEVVVGKDAVAVGKDADSLDFTAVSVNGGKPDVESSRAAARRSALDIAASIVAQQDECAPVSSNVQPPPQRAAPAPLPVPPKAAAVAPVASAPARATPNASDEKARAKPEVLKRAVILRKDLGMLVACSYLKEHGWTVEEAREMLNRICPA